MKQRSLDRLTEDSEEMKESFKLSVKEIEAVLARKKPMTDMVKLAAGVVANYTRIRSTEVHDKGLEIILMRNDQKSLPEPEK